jgi:phosphate transport system permease protein
VSVASTATAAPERAAAPARRRRKNTDRGFDRGFRYLSVAAGVLILVVLAAVAAFLVAQGLPALRESDLASKVQWIPKGGNLWTLTGPLIFGTILAAAVSLVIAVPVSIGIALFISHYAPRRLATVLGYIVDLLAAIPSVVFGLWGILVLAPHVQQIWQFLADWLGWFPLFAPDAQGNASNPPRVLLTTAFVLAVMILPIITAVCREVFLQTPRLHEEAALALGATRWELVKMAVLPFGRSGVISAAMLGLGRALGETMAVLMVLSPWGAPKYAWSLLVASQQQTIAANIAAKFNDADDMGRSTLIATGLALFVITMLVNMAARWIVSRRKDFSGAN